jgi:hypothetical protein
MMGTIKVGAFSSPRKKACQIIIVLKQEVKKNFILYYFIARICRLCGVPSTLNFS